MTVMKNLHALILASVLAASGAAAASPDDAGPIVAIGFEGGSQTLIKADEKALYRSSDGGREWVATALPPVARGHLATMTVAGKGKGALYLAGPGMGVLRSDDGGRSWVARNKGLPDGKVIALTVHADQPDTVYAVLAEHGIFRTEDGSASWRLMDKGPKEKIVQIVHSNMPGSMQSGWLFAATTKGVSRAMDCFCGWRDAGGLAGNVSAVSYDPGQPQHVYAATSDGLFLSVNGGEQWTKTVSPSSATITALLATSDALYAATGDGQLYRSADRAKTWNRVRA
jgi:photosystem II stability/assembly factor-like uncharacterized protein